MIILTRFFSPKPSALGLTQDLVKAARERVEKLEIRQLQQAHSWMGEAGSQEGAKSDTGDS